MHLISLHYARLASTAVSLCVALILTASPGHARCNPTWNIVNSPNIANRDNQLSKLAVVSASDMWVVGNSTTGLSPRQTLIQHWNGSKWSIVSSPNSSKPINWLTGVEAVASNNVWAIGYSADSQDSSSVNQTLTMRWNGSTWNIVPSPNPRPNNPDLGPYPVSNELFDLAVVSANDIWAVGQSYTFSNGQPLIMHWNGTAWSVVRAPDTGDYGVLYSVDAVSANDVWAVGTEYHQGNQVTLVQHWDGTRWSVVPSPNVGPYVQVLLGVKARAADDIWAVGYHLAVFGVEQKYQTSILHFDGTRWSVVPSPNVNQENQYLYDIVPIARDNAYAVGFFDNGQLAYLTMIQHWDGHTWTIMPSPNASNTWNSLYGVAAASANNAWAVGEESNGFSFETLVLRLTDPCSGTTMHVANIDPSFRATSADTFRIRASVTIQDTQGMPVSGAVVTARFRRPDSSQSTRTAMTNAGGVANAVIASPLTGTYTITVTNVTRSGGTYEPSANVETSDTVNIR